MESDLPAIREAPFSIVILVTKSAAFESFGSLWLPMVEKGPADSRLVVVADADVTNCPTHPRLRVVRHAQPLGFGACLQTALWSVETPLVFFVPSDGSLPPDQAAEFFDHIDGAHLVVGCRGADRVPPAIRLFDFGTAIAARVLIGYAPEPRIGWPGAPSWRRCLARRVFGVPLLDPDSGIVLARSDVFRRFPIQSHGSFAWVELLAKANHVGCMIGEVGVAATPRSDDDGDGRDRFGRDAWRLFRNPDFGPWEGNAVGSRPG